MKICCSKGVRFKLNTVELTVLLSLSTHENLLTERSTKLVDDCVISISKSLYTHNENIIQFKLSMIQVIQIQLSCFQT